MTIVGSTGSAFYSDGDQSLTIGTPYRAIVTATIDGSTRSFPATVLAVDTSAAANIAQSVWRRTSSQLVADGTAGGAGSAAEVMNEVISDVAGVGTLVSAVDTVVDAILVDTGTTLPATLATVDANVDAILLDTGTTLPATLTTIEGKVDTVDGVVDSIVIDIAAINDVAAAAVATAILDAANGIETGVTPRQALRGILSALGAKVSGMDSNAPVFRDVGDTKDRITAATDSNGNRTSVTLDLT